MGVMSLLVFLLGFSLIAFLAFYSEYNRMIRKRKPEYFGLDTFQQVTRWQTSEWQHQAKSKGITLAEWQRLCNQQLDWVETTLKNHASISS